MREKQVTKESRRGSKTGKKGNQERKEIRRGRKGAGDGKQEAKKSRIRTKE